MFLDFSGLEELFMHSYQISWLHCCYKWVYLHILKVGLLWLMVSPDDHDDNSILTFLKICIT